MTFWKRRNVVLCFIIFYRRFLLSNILPNPYLFESLLRCENTVNVHARVPFSAQAEIPFRLHEAFSDFQARLAGLKIQARLRIPG